MPEIKNFQNIIEVKDISFSYPRNEVLQNISFTVPRGDYLGIIGPNGAGKTTLLKIILGLLAPSNGFVQLFGKDIRNFKDWSKIGYVPQKATGFDINFPATAYEVVLMGRYEKRGLFHMVNAEDKKAVQHALEQVQMQDYKDRLVGNLSLGQQQRVFIARALASNPEIIFLDEPTVSIDQKTRDDFYALLKKLNEALQMTVILISHDVDVLTKQVAHIVCIDKTLVCHTTPEEFIKQTHAHHALPGDVQIFTHHHPN